VRVIRILLRPTRRLVSSTIGTSAMRMPSYIIFMVISIMHSKPARSTMPAP
jgi:hypothetical protein